VDKVLLNKLYHYGHHFVSFSQLFNSPFGYGGSLPGLIDGLSFQLGKIHLAALLIGLVLFSYLFWKKKTIDKPVFFIALILFLGAVFMTLTPSRFIWRRVKPFWYVQFPWRFLGVAGPFLCLAAGFSLRFKKKKINSLVAILLVLSALIINLKFFKPEKSQLFLKDADLLTEEEIKWEVSRSSFEYLPRGAVLKEVERGTKLAPAISQDELVEKRVEIIQGEGEIELEADKTHQLKFRTSAQEELELELNIFSFPGWQVLVDDQKINYQDNNDLRLMTFSLPPGEHQVEVEFQRTAVRQWADIISLFSLFLSFFSSFYIIERRSNDEVSSIYK